MNGRPPRRPADLVPHRQPGPVRRRDAAPGRRASRRSSSSSSTPPAAIPVTVEFQPVLTERRRSTDGSSRPTADATCVGVITWMHTFSPAKMWINGLDALQKPLLHLHTQANVELPWATIDMDFMNLNQAAHGDREFAHVLTRARRARARPSPATCPTRRSSPASRRGRGPRCGWQELRTLKLARFGDNMRDVAVTEGDKVEAQIRFGVVRQHVGRQRPRRQPSTPPATATSTSSSPSTRTAYDVAPELRRGGDRHESLRYGARIELGLRSFLEPGGFGAFTTNFEDLGGLRQLPGLAVQRLMADGYGFGAEGDWKTAVMLRTLKVVADGQPGGTSFMEDYTYSLVPGHERILGAHMLEVCPSIAGAATPTLEIHPLSIGNREDPVRLKFTAAPGPRHRRRHRRHRRSLPADRQRDRRRRAGRAAAPSSPSRVRCGSRSPNLRTSAECWLTAGGPHHTVLSTAIGREELEDFAAMARTELVVIDDATTTNEFATRAALEPGLPPPRPGALTPCDQSQQQQQPRGCGLGEGEHHGSTFTTLTSRPTAHNGGDSGRGRRAQPSGLLAGAGSPAAGRCRQLPGDAGMELRVRQPRDDERVLGPDDLRARGCLGNARPPDAAVDRLGNLRDRRDGQRLRGGDRR